MKRETQLALMPSNRRTARAVFSHCEVHGDSDVQASIGGVPVATSACPAACSGRRYRYQLWWPTGAENDSVALGVFANPSTATADDLDPTLTRWRNYCRAWGYGWSVTANVRAWRETNPKLVPDDPQAIGPENDRHLNDLVCGADVVVCGWGKLGGARGPVVLDLIRKAGKVPHALKLNGDGSPAHPLYLASKLKPFPMEDTCSARTTTR